LYSEARKRARLPRPLVVPHPSPAWTQQLHPRPHHCESLPASAKTRPSATNRLVLTLQEQYKLLYLDHARITLCIPRRPDSLQHYSISRV
jgi:hypothetical protein